MVAETLIMITEKGLPCRIPLVQCAVDPVRGQINGLNPWPCAYTLLGGESMKLYLARPVECAAAGEPGEVVVSSAKEGLVVRCGEGALEILEMQAPGGKRMAAKAYLMGRKIEAGTRLGGQHADE